MKEKMSARLLWREHRRLVKALLPYSEFLCCIIPFLCVTHCKKSFSLHKHLLSWPLSLNVSPIKPLLSYKIHIVIWQEITWSFLSSLIILPRWGTWWRIANSRLLISTLISYKNHTESILVVYVWKTLCLLLIMATTSLIIF